jgi:S-adenosylmethionine:tRNA ribosyltransferase-isomerase
VTTHPDALLSSWDYNLPEDRIATRPLAERSASRMLHLPPGGGVVHRMFRDLPQLLQPGDVLVLNDSSVMRARVDAKRPSGGAVRLLLARPAEAQPDDVRDMDVLCLWSSSKPAKPGDVLHVSDALRATVLHRVDDEPGAWLIRFHGDIWAHAAAHGHIPLPPYMRRDDDEEDDHRYQTVFRDEGRVGSSAAPTAGLHFDDEVLGQLRTRGVEFVHVTLHVGPGTFLPVRHDDLDEHVMHGERAFIDGAAAERLQRARNEGRRIIAVGTTAARTLESCWRAHGRFVAYAALTKLFIRPGQEVGSINGLITNFHAPRTTLMVLVGALVGRARILDAYALAVRQGYRFLSYGDCCFLETTSSTQATSAVS